MHRVPLARLGPRQFYRQEERLQAHPQPCNFDVRLGIVAHGVNVEATVLGRSS